jgi:Pentapeptide repeats (8 copies)
MSPWRLDSWSTTLPPASVVAPRRLGADLTGGARLVKAKLTGARLAGANLTDANLYGADLTGEGRGGALEGQAAGGARVARAGDVGDVQRRPAARGRARRRLIRLTIDHRIIASLLAGNVS